MSARPSDYAAPRRYAATLEMLFHFRHPGALEMLFHFRHPECPSGPGWWSIADAPLDRAYFCPWCGQQLEPPQSAGAADGAA